MRCASLIQISISTYRVLLRVMYVRLLLHTRCWRCAGVLTFDQQIFVSIPLSDIIPNTSSLLLSDVTFTPPIPLGLKPGDADLDGFPDLLAITVDSYGDAYTPRLLRNVGCSRGVPGCGVEGNGRRGFKVASGNAIELLEGINDARGVAWVDLDEDVSHFVSIAASGIGTDTNGLGTGNARYPGAKDWEAGTGYDHFRTE